MLISVRMKHIHQMHITHFLQVTPTIAITFVNCSASVGGAAPDLVSGTFKLMNISCVYVLLFMLNQLAQLDLKCQTCGQGRLFVVAISFALFSSVLQSFVERPLV